MTTLQKKYTANKISKLQTKISFIDNSILNENLAANLILEAMDENEIQKASAVIEKLKNVASKAKSAKNLITAIKNAITDVNKYTGGNALEKMGQELLTKLTGSDNPIIKALALSQCLEKGFGLMPQIIKNLSLDEGDGKTLASRLDQNDQQKGQKALYANMTKAFTPSGIFGAFKKVPYANIAAIIQEFIQDVPVTEIQEIINSMKQGPQATELASDVKDAMKSGAASGGAVAPAGGKNPEAAKGSAAGEASGGTSPAVAGDEKVTPTGNKKISNDTVKAVAGDAARKLNIDYEDAERMIRYLRKIGKLQEAIDTGVLTLTVNREKLSKLIKLFTIAPRDNIVSTHLCE